MHRFAALAAAAAAVIATSAHAESIHISTAGKTTDQLKAQVMKAAGELCSTELSSIHVYDYHACVQNTASPALAQIAARDQVATR